MDGYGHFSLMRSASAVKRSPADARARVRGCRSDVVRLMMYRFFATKEHIYAQGMALQSETAALPSGIDPFSAWIAPHQAWIAAFSAWITPHRAWITRTKLGSPRHAWRAALFGLILRAI